MVYSSARAGFGNRRHQQPYRRRLQLELLEDRCVPTTITPTSFADGVLGSGSLRDAVLQFNADTGTGDDIIQLQAGTYALTIRNVGSHHETAGLTGDLNLTQASHHWIIQGTGPSTVIDASQLQDRVFQIVTPGTQVVFRDLVIQGGLAQDDGSDGTLAGTTDALGGGLLNNGGQVTLDNVVVQNNVARGGSATSYDGHNARGGGFYSTGSSLDISDSRIASNRATGGRGADGYTYYTFFGSRITVAGGTGGAAQGGGLYVNGGSLTIASSTIASNQGTGGAGGAYGDDGPSLGGGLYNGGTLTVTDSTLSGNSSSGREYSAGGGIYNAGTLTVTGSTLSGNSATYEGGGIYNDFYGTLTVSNSTLTGNCFSSGADHSGGGIYNAGTLTVTGSTLSGNSAVQTSNAYGGGIYNGGTLMVTDSTLCGNIATGFLSDGGGIFNNGTLMVTDSTLCGNIATSRGDWPSYGGGIFNDHGTLTVTGSTLSGNSAIAGGGIFNDYGTLTVTGSTLSGNSASYSGGGIYGHFGMLTVSNSTLSGNSAYYGGGICSFGTLTVSNSTLYGNSAYYGGGIFTNYTLPVTLTNVTISANRANTDGGGLVVGSGSPVLHNTLIAGNFRGAPGTTPDDVNGALNSGGDYNLIGDGTGMTGLSNGVNGNLVGSAAVPIDPLLGPLQDNGGPTKTHALLAGSPALNAGNPAQLGVADQRGVVRSGGVNIGAYQASASAFILTVPGTVAAGTPFDVTVQAVDIFGQAAFGYTGTVTFTTSDPDPAVVLPVDHAFTADDQGMHTFTEGFTLITPGMWTLTAADLANGLSQDVILTVDP
jgi:hypothetical protein